MSEYFLLTYSVENVGMSWDQDKADNVRDSIRELTLSSIIDLGEDIHEPFYEWEKLSSVETTVKGMIKVGSGSFSSKRDKAKDSIKKLFVKILKEHRAKANTTVIHCAVLISEAGETFEFVVTA